MRLTLIITGMIFGAMLAYARLMAVAAEAALPGPYEYNTSGDSTIVHLPPASAVISTAQAN
jgi:hypothetical protein